MTMTTLAGLLWFLGFAALAWIAVAATVRARRRGQHLESRGGLLAAASLVAGVAVVGAWAWSAAPAREGAERRAREGIAVELAIEQLAAPFAARGGGEALILGFAGASGASDDSDAGAAPAGTSADAASSAARHRIAGRGPAEVVRVQQLEGGARWRFEAGPDVVLRALPSSGPLTLSQRTSLAEACRAPRAAIGDAAAAPTPAATSSSANRTAPASANAPATAIPPALSPAASPSTSPASSASSASRTLWLTPAAAPTLAIAAVICDGDSAWRAVLLGAGAPRGEAPAYVAFAPLAGPRWLSPRLTAAAGSLLHLDGGDAQLPGLRSWNLSAGGPGGIAAAGWVLAIPEEPRACERWLEAGRPAAAAAARDRVTALNGACRLERGGIVVRATPLLPDAAGVQARALAAAALIAGPAVGLLLALALVRGSRRRTALVAPALGLGALAAGLCALLCWRLLWAHRIDLLRDVTVAGWRVADNQLAALLVGAALAGLAGALLAEHGLRHRAARLAAPLGAWLAWMIAAVAALEAARTSGGVSALALPSPRLGLLPLLAASALLPLVPELLRRFQAMPARARFGAVHALAALAALAIAGKLLAPKLVLLKLAIAYAIVVAGHAALRAALRAETAPSRRFISVAATAAAAIAMLAFDGGVALAITGVGLLGAMVMAGHDAMYSDAAGARLGLLEREHARILAAYGVAAAALAAALIGWGLVADDRLLIEHTADLVLHIPLAVAGLFALGALLARRHRQPATAWVAAALAALALWGYRQPAIERVMAGRGVSAHRVSAVVDPGYALLRDERRFMAQTSAWQAATLPAEVAETGEPGGGEGDGAPLAAPSAAARWQGQGLAGSRVADPGVARSIDNDYLPILVARELGVAGLMRTTLLLLSLLLVTGALAGARLPHASAMTRIRKLVLTVVGALCIYQPLAALGILPLTGISWPGLGVDSPADLWVACFGLTWCLFGGAPLEQLLERRRAATASDGGALEEAAGVGSVGSVGRAGGAGGVERLGSLGRAGSVLAHSTDASVDERVREAPRLRRARAAIALALGAAGLAGVAMVARAGDSALGRTALRAGSKGSGDVRVDRAIAYARSLTCTAAPGAALPDLSGAPSDATTARFHRELLGAWQGQRALLLRRLVPGGEAKSSAARPPAGAQQAKSAEGGKSTKTAKSEKSAKAAKKAKPAKAAKPSDARRQGASPGGDDDAVLVRKPDSGPDGELARGDDEAAPADAAPTSTGEVGDGRDAGGAAAAMLAACQGRLQKWRLERTGDDGCRAIFDAGWPQIRVELRPAGDALTSTCHVDIPGDPIAQLMPSPPPSARRIRLVSRAMGDAASDLGELLVGSTVIRLRRGAPAISLEELEELARATPAMSPDDPQARPVLRLASRVQLGATAALELDDAGAGVRLIGRAQAWTSTAASASSPAAWTRTAPIKPVAVSALAPGGAGSLAAGATSPGAAASGRTAPLAQLAAASLAQLAAAAAAQPGRPPAPRAPPAAPLLDRITLLVGDTASPRAALFRPRRSWPDAYAAAAAPTATVDPLLADDVLAVSDRPRRAYPFGAALPMLGWVNPYAVDRSLGLDGWVHAALAAPSPSAPSLSSSSATAADAPADAATAAQCGTLAPAAIAPASVCAPSPLDGVLECRVSLQPELSLALADRLAALLRDPKPLTGRPIAPMRAAVVLLRGDTGEILSHTDRTWGRAPSAYAPRTAKGELALIRLREDRDPRTGEPGEPGESEAERVDWNQPIAVGSTLKPVVARAAELAFPELTPQLVLGFSGAAPQCKGRRGAGFSAILGHCPPTSLTGAPITSDLREFLSHSPNWYQAALGLIGLGLPDGGFATGDTSRSLLELLASDLSSWPTEEPLVIRDAAGPILGKRGVVVAGLRRTPLWQNIERVLGRPLCTLGDRKSCVAAASRRDVCAARALPLPGAGADLRHLVALGPDRFDFYGDNRPRQTQVPTREYLQWLRGSGVHPVGSLAQLADAFGRVIYEAEDGAAASTPAIAAARLAASWFPAPAAGVLPTWRCQAADASRSASASGMPSASVRGEGGGLCAVIAEGGTAHRAVAQLFSDARLTLYGAKTGTIDSLATVARNRKSCEAWNRRHTVAGQPLALASQPGWLECGKAPPDDSLFVLAFSVATPAGPVPLTLGISLQRAGKGSAARLAPHLIAAIADYFDDK